MASIYPENLGYPGIPEFNTLCIRGSYPPSAPLHLCFSHIARLDNPYGTVALVLSPSRQQLLESLKDDTWLTQHSGTGAVAALSQHARILYPSSIRHLRLALATLHVSEPSNDPSWNPKVTFPSSPSLIVLHEISSYLQPHENLENNPSTNPPPTLASYMTLISEALAASAFLSEQNTSPNSIGTRLALFDFKLDTLQLPILRTPQHAPHASEVPEDIEDAPRVEAVFTFVQKYFDYHLTFESAGNGVVAGNESMGAPEPHPPVRRMARLTRGQEVIHEYPL